MQRAGPKASSEDKAMTQPGPLSWSDYLDSQFAAAGRSTGIDPWLLRAMAIYESRLKPDFTRTDIDAATGKPDRHDGLMQLSVANQKAYGVTDPFQPGQNILGGAELLRDNLNVYGGDLDKALQQYNGGYPPNWGPYTRAYVQIVRKNYKELTGQEAPRVLPQFAPESLPPPVLRPGSATTPDESVPPPLLRPRPTSASGHPTMNVNPSAGPSFAQSQPDAQTTAQMPLGAPAANRAGIQRAVAFELPGPVQQPMPASQAPSPFVQAFLTNAILGGGSPPYPFAMGTGIRPGGPGGR